MRYFVGEGFRTVTHLRASGLVSPVPKQKVKDTGLLATVWPGYLPLTSEPLRGFGSFVRFHKDNAPVPAVAGLYKFLSDQKVQGVYDVVAAISILLPQKPPFCDSFQTVRCLWPSGEIFTDFASNRGYSSVG